jgi:hypothetical protein
LRWLETWRRKVERCREIEEPTVVDAGRRGSGDDNLLEQLKNLLSCQSVIMHVDLPLLARPTRILLLAALDYSEAKLLPL